MHAACKHEQEMVDNVIPELQDKASDHDKGTIGQGIN